MPGFISKESQDLLKKLLVINPDKRLDAEEILTHSWIKNVELDRPLNHYYNIMDVIYYKQDYLIKLLDRYSKN